jgi:hypothetical protein
MATNAWAAGHPGGQGRSGHAVAARASGGRVTTGYARGGHVARYGGGYGYGYNNGPIYDSCPGYGYDNGYGYGYNNGCAGYGVPLVGAVVNGVFGGYGRY